jgi:organic radical activating enzyme
MLDPREVILIQINSQPIEKRVESDGSVLDVHSIFYTIQGEGPYCGWPCVFVRLAGCNLQCPSCDTEYTEGREKQHVEYLVNGNARILDLFGDAPRKLVVITGGEPFRQNIVPLIKLLTNAGIHVQIETNGTQLPPNGFCELWAQDKVTVVCSPKSGKVQEGLFPFIDAYKYVLDHNSIGPDGLPFAALNHTVGPKGVARPHKGFDGPIYLQPMDPKDGAHYLRNVRAVKNACMKHGYILQLQVHKIIGVE